VMLFFFFFFWSEWCSWSRKLPLNIAAYHPFVPSCDDHCTLCSATAVSFIAVHQPSESEFDYQHYINV
jgi:hypothetical protein